VVENTSADVELGNLWRERPRVVDDMMSPKPFNPLLGFRPRGGGDDDEIRALSSDLDGDRPDPTRTTDDEDRRRPGNGLRHVQAIEHGFPGRQRREWQRRRFRPVERRGFTTDDPGVDEMELRIGARPYERSGIIDLVAYRELRHVGADLLHDPGRIPSQHFPIAISGRRAAADFVVDRVDRDSLHLNQDIASFSDRPRQINVDQRGVLGDGSRNLVTNGFHRCLQLAVS
jgi:hypothetical protein